LEQKIQKVNQLQQSQGFLTEGALCGQEEEMKINEIIEAAGVGIVTKQNATKDVPVGGEYMNVKKLRLAKENFADGKRKGKSRPGRVKRSGASCKGSVSSLRSKAKKYGGERGKMYHWCANMKSGRSKKK
jgi:hypothetical protein